jgi:hypothetical protein
MSLRVVKFPYNKNRGTGKILQKKSVYTIKHSPLR